MQMVPVEASERLRFFEQARQINMDECLRSVANEPDQRLDFTRRIGAGKGNAGGANLDCAFHFQSGPGMKPVDLNEERDIQLRSPFGKGCPLCAVTHARTTSDHGVHTGIRERMGDRFGICKSEKSEG